MNSSVILPKDVQISKLKYSDVKPLSNGSKTVYINYGAEKLTIQTPIMHLPYGIGDWNDKAKDGVKGAANDDDKFKKYDLSVSFVGMDENPKLKAFHDKVVEIEKKIKEDAFNNRLAWLRDDYDGIKNITDKLFSPILRLDKDKDTGKLIGKYPPTMKLKLPYDNKTEDFTFDCHDMDKNEIDFKSVMTRLKGAKAQMIIQLTGMWFAGGKYGCTWKVLRGKFQLPNKGNYDYVEDSDEEALKSKPRDAFQYDEDLEEEAEAMSKVMAKKAVAAAAVVIDDDEEEDLVDGIVGDDEVDSDLEEVPVKPTKKAVAAAVVEVEEDEDEEEEEEEEEEAPPPPPVKKPVAKKAAAKK